MTDHGEHTTNDLDEPVRSWHDRGFAILPGHLATADLQEAVADLPMLYPTAAEYHDGADPERNRRFDDEHGGITDFPFASVDLSLLAVHDSLIDLAERLLGTADLRVIGIETWAKYTGAATYDQHHHRDYLSHSLVAPSTDRRYEVLEMFVLLQNTPQALGPTSVVPRYHTAALPAIPNWFPKLDVTGGDGRDRWHSSVGRPDLYANEVLADGPAGTVLAYTNTTFHRGTELTLPRGARYTLMVNIRPAGNDWNTRHNWQQHATTDAWRDFVARATPRQLALFGWPPPGHPYWTDETVVGTQLRYPDLDMAPWRPSGATSPGRRRRMHADEVDVDEDLVSRLVGAQFPDLAALPLAVVEPWGTDNAIWRLGPDLVVRLPRIHWATGQPQKEETWLPRLAAHLPVAIPEPVAIGEPGFDYPYRWALHRWLPGLPAALERMSDPTTFAHDLVAVVRALNAVPVDGAPPAHNRARPLAEYDDATRRAIDRASHLIDAAAALTAWEDALAAPAHHGPPVWVHGDLEGNCILTDGRLSGLVDWGSACAGDPAVDVQVVWSPLFTENSRRAFLKALDVDDATLARSRGAAVNQACAALPYYLDTYPLIVDRSLHKLAALGIRTTVGDRA
jgi:aminoglycoside phosphotransferase (APT) family kinase protein